MSDLVRTAGGFQSMPNSAAPLTGDGALISPPWYRWMMSLWRKAGGAVVSLADAVFLTFSGGQLAVFQSSDGTELGILVFAGSVGGPAEPQSPVTSPFTYTANFGGTLVVTSASCELSRDDGVTWYLVSPMGGAVPVMNRDRVRVTWFGGLPLVTFFPVAVRP